MGVRERAKANLEARRDITRLTLPSYRVERLPGILGAAYYRAACDRSRRAGGRPEAGDGDRNDRTGGT